MRHGFLRSLWLLFATATWTYPEGVCQRILYNSKQDVDELWWIWDRLWWQMQFCPLKWEGLWASSLGRLLLNGVRKRAWIMWLSAKLHSFHEHWWALQSRTIGQIRCSSGCDMAMAAAVEVHVSRQSRLRYIVYIVRNADVQLWRVSMNLKHVPICMFGKLCQVICWMKGRWESQFPISDREFCHFIIFCGWDSGMWYAIVRIFRGPVRSFVYRPGRPALTWTARRSVNAADAADGGVESRLVSAIAAGEVPIGCQTPSNAQNAP